MDEFPLVRLDLRAPLFFNETPDLKPFDCSFPQDESGRELLFCFELDREQAASIEPAEDCFPGRLVFAAVHGQSDGTAGNVRLPAGLYLFAQRRGALKREECVRMAIEQQMDGLWERLKPGSRLYIRYLFEDGSPVTQLFRPIS